MTHYKNTMQQLVDKIKAISKDEYVLDYVDQLEQMDFDFDYFEFNSANDMIAYTTSILIKINNKTNNMENQTKLKLDLNWFEDKLMMYEMDAEGDIDNFDACNDHHWNQMKELALDMTYDYFIEMGYTKNEIDEITDER